MDTITWLWSGTVLMETQYFLKPPVRALFVLLTRNKNRSSCNIVLLWKGKSNDLRNIGYTKEMAGLVPSDTNLEPAISQMED